MIFDYINKTIIRNDYYYLLLYSLIQLVFGYALFYDRKVGLAPAMNDAFIKYSQLGIRDWAMIDAFNKVQRKS